MESYYNKVANFICNIKTYDKEEVHISICLRTDLGYD